VRSTVTLREAQYSPLPAVHRAQLKIAYVIAPRD
jgi:hypothetical protein